MENTSRFSRWFLVGLALAVIFTAGMVVDRTMLKNIDGEDSSRRLLREPANEYSLINPLLGFEIAGKEEFVELRSLGKKLERAIKHNIQAGNVKTASVYFRDLKTGRWTGFNEDEKFAPASLLKVYMMLTYFKVAENDPGVLKEKLFYGADIDRNQFEYYRPSTSLTGGTLYPVSELIERMIIQSGNNSYYLLNEHAKKEAVDRLFTDLGVTLPKSFDEVDFMSAKAYSFMFRVLYNATYLTRAMSQQALELLAKTEFKKGLVAGMPPDIQVVHKFGERSFRTATGEEIKELHDCGIVYYPDHPFFLCIMTKGNTYPELEQIIRDLAELVYKDTKMYYN